MSSLTEKLAAALESRDRRLIRRHLPELSTSTTEIDFTSNDYLSLSTSTQLNNAVLAALSASQHILGSGGSRLLVPAPAHAQLEARLSHFFNADAALLFNSGFDANVGFFSTVPQPGDVVLYDAYIHASVHDGMRLSRLPPDALVSFPHNSVHHLHLALSKLIDDRQDLRKGKSSVFVAVESLYSMDGTIAPLTRIVQCVEELLPSGNGHIVVDEAHATGIYGPKGRGLVADLALENRVFARLHTFGKALAASGAVFLTTELVKNYLINYARSLVFTTALPFANIIAINCSLDLLEDGTVEALSKHLLATSSYFVDLLRSELKKYPPSLIRLPDHLAIAVSDRAQASTLQSGLVPSWEFDPGEQTKTCSPNALRHGDTLATERLPHPSPIIPILTPDPRALAAFLLSYTPPPSDDDDASATPQSVLLRTKPIFPPTIPKNTARVRICLHAGHTFEDVALLARAIGAWAEERVAEARQGRAQWQEYATEVGVEAWMASKL